MFINPLDSRRDQWKYHFPTHATSQTHETFYASVLSLEAGLVHIERRVKINMLMVLQAIKVEEEMRTNAESSRKGLQCKKKAGGDSRVTSGV